MAWVGLVLGSLKVVKALGPGIVGDEGTASQPGALWGWTAGLLATDAIRVPAGRKATLTVNPLITGTTAPNGVAVKVRRASGSLPLGGVNDFVDFRDTETTPLTGQLGLAVMEGIPAGYYKFTSPSPTVGIATIVLELE